MMNTSLEWKTLKRTTILKDEWIDLEASECQLPNGKVIAPFYVNHSRDFVVIVAVTKEKELLVETGYRAHRMELLFKVTPNALSNIIMHGAIWSGILSHWAARTWMIQKHWRLTLYHCQA